MMTPVGAATNSSDIMIRHEVGMWLDAASLVSVFRRYSGRFNFPPKVA
jgi:hypothetical protein